MNKSHNIKTVLKFTKKNSDENTIKMDIKITGNHTLDEFVLSDIERHINSIVIGGYSKEEK